MDKINARTIIFGGNGRDFSIGFDTIEDLERLPEGFSGVIWTNKIQNIAREIKNDH